MSQIDWIVLIVTLLTIISYGLYKSRTSKNLDGYFLSNRSLPWGLILLSIMGTQASAITFLSAPGQAYTDGILLWYSTGYGGYLYFFRSYFQQVKSVHRL
jgi:solute:Na+ symporter, SSS family